MRRKRRGLARALAWGLILFGTSVCFFWAREAALAARGYAAIGGEWLLWLLPGVLWAYLRTGREMREEWKDGDTESERAGRDEAAGARKAVRG